MSKTKSFALILGVIIMSFLIGYLVFAWGEPTAAPPEENVLAPINVSGTAQTKSGALTIGGDLTTPRLVDLADSSYFIDPAGQAVTNYSAILKGKVGIGTTTLFTDGLHVKTSYIVGSARDETVLNLEGGTCWGTTPTTLGGCWPFSYKDPGGSWRQLIGVSASNSLPRELVLNIPYPAGGSGPSRLRIVNSATVDDAHTKMVVEDTGNVGIGTPSPGAKLEVVGGAIKATGGLIIETRTSDPASPVNGQIWLRTDL